MFGQTFSLTDLPVIGSLILLEGLLSADNAMVLALMVKHLPHEAQKRALLYGLGGAFVFRLLMILGATWIIQFWWLQLLGAAYLIWLPLKHFWGHGGGGKIKAKEGGFWLTVLRVELVDIAFALDSVLAAVATVDTAANPDKTWVVVAGGILGVVLLRFAAGAFIQLIEKFPALDHLAYLLVGWAGVKMVSVSAHTFELSFEKANPGQHPPIHIPHMPPAVFWTGMGLIALIGGIYAWRKGPASADPEIAEVVEDVQDILEDPRDDIADAIRDPEGDDVLSPEKS